MARPKAIRVATFNCENLFLRYKFNTATDPAKAVQEGWYVDQAKFDIYNDAEKRITAEAIKLVDADVLALQEVEGVQTLKKFRDLYLGGRKAYPYVAGIDGNDPRLIDVVVLSRLPLVHVRSHQQLCCNGGKDLVFSRDCLEVDVLTPSKTVLTLYVNHLKSMLEMHPKKGQTGRMATREKRQIQCRTIKQIVTDRFGRSPGQHPFAILGDFNDYLATDAEGETGIDGLVKWKQVENVVGRLPKDEQWTHYYAEHSGVYQQLDYLLLSQSLAEENGDSLPVIERRGLALNAKKYTGPRIKGVGKKDPCASDHCPVRMDLIV